MQFVSRTTVTRKKPQFRFCLKTNHFKRLQIIRFKLSTARFQNIHQEVRTRKFISKFTSKINSLLNYGKELYSIIGTRSFFKK